MMEYPVNLQKRIVFEPVRMLGTAKYKYDITTEYVL